MTMKVNSFSHFKSSGTLESYSLNTSLTCPSIIPAMISIQQSRKSDVGRNVALPKARDEHYFISPFIASDCEHGTLFSMYVLQSNEYL